MLIEQFKASTVVRGRSMLLKVRLTFQIAQIRTPEPKSAYLLLFYKLCLYYLKVLI